MTFEVEPDASEGTERQLERIHEVLVNEFDYDPDDLLVESSEDGISVTLGAGVGSMD